MEKTKAPWWQPAISLFAEISGWIILPAIVAFLVGHWLDNQYKTGQWLYFGCVGVAFLISMIGIVRGSIRAMKTMDKLSKKEKSEKTK
ncbi:MAG: hypothetical protein WC752_01430 [Patescibacteria group bacterium]|jgi:uncharacterized membrane protein YcjF (UPF0283 family)